MAKRMVSLFLLSLAMLGLPVTAQTDQFQIAFGDTVSDGVPGPGAGNIEVAGAQDIYTFDATAGDEVIFDSLVGNNGVFGWRLEAPDGSVLFDSFNVDRRAALTLTGTYMFTVRGFQANTTGVYSFRLLLVPLPQIFAINIGDTISNGAPAAGAGNLEVPGAVDIYTFDGIAGGGVIFDALVGNTGLARVILTAPDGTQLFSGFYLDQQAAFPQSGIYTLRVEGLNITSTGIYSFQLLNIAPSQIFAISIGDTVSDGVPEVGAGNLEAPGAIDIYNYDGVAGQGLIFDAMTGNSGQFRVILTAPDGTELFNAFFLDQQVALPQTGTYSLQVAGSVVTNFGTYSFQIIDIPTVAEEFAISIGDTVSNGVPAAGAGNLEVPGAVDIYTFDGLTSQIIIFDALVGDSGQFRVILTAPDGTELFNNFYLDHQVTLPQMGTYSLRVAGGLITNFGTYSFQLINVPPDPQEFAINLGDTVSNGVPETGTGNIEVPGAVDVYSFDAVARQDVIFDALVGDSGQFRVTLTAPDSTELFNDFYLDQQVTLPQTGAYSLRVTGNLVTNFGTYSFQLLSVPPDAQEFTISIGDTVSDGVPEAGAGNLEVPGAVDIYRFDGVAGQNVIFDALAGNTGQFRVILTAPDGTPLFDTFLIDQEVSLSQTGIYSLTLHGLSVTDFGMYSFTLVEITNSSPVATNDSAITDEDVAVTIDVLSNDSDVDGDTLSVESITQPTNGGAGINPDNTVTYTPNADFNGADSFIYGVSDGNGGTDTATVTITINPVNDNPVAVDDTTTTDEDVAVIVDVLANDTDVDGDTLSVESVTQPTSGSAGINPDNTVTYTPNADFSGADSFTYIVSDGNGGTDTATVSSIINPVNDNPVAVDDTAISDEDVAVTIDVLSNDSDVDGDTLSVESVTAPTNGSALINADDTITYTPNTGFSGTDSFTYTVVDGNGGMAAATVTVTVNAAANTPPIAFDDDYVVDEDTLLTVIVGNGVLNNDSDADGDALSATLNLGPFNGTLTLNTDGSFNYQPNANYNGPDSFTYIINDGNGGSDMATVHITINPVNDAPLAVDDTAITAEDVAVTIDVLSNDTDVDGDTLSVESVTQPTNGSVVNNGTDVTYTPNANFNGADSFTYTVSDDNGGTVTATVNITINPVNDNPVAVDDTATTDEDTVVIIDVLSNDSDVDGDTLSVESVTQPINGSAGINPDNTVTYTPNSAFNGTDSFTYVVSDGNGGTATATVTVTVNAAANIPPLAANDGYLVDEDTLLTVNAGNGVLSNDTDTDGDPLNATLTTVPGNGNLTFNGDGSFNYQPNPNFNGVDSFTYTVSYGNSGSDMATVTITINPVNDVPVAVDDTATTDTDVATTINVLSNDTDVDGDTLSVQSVTQPTNGSAVNNGTDVTYTPTTGFNGADGFTYIASDGNGGTDTATVTITVGSSAVQEVKIDILPFIWLNIVNLNSRGHLPVAILSDSGFDARFVDANTVSLAGAPAVRPSHFWPKFTLLDVNFDHRKDMIVYFDIQELELDSSATEATLLGETYAGVSFMGTDRVIVVPPIAPTTITPRDEEVIHTNWPIIRWYPVALNTCYHIQINDVPFTTEEQPALQEATVVILSHYRANDLPADTYYWRVRVGGNCQVNTGPWSEMTSFSIQPR